MFTGRISKAKGLEQVQILIHSLIKQDPNIILLVVGKEVKFDKTIQKNVINTKWLSNKEINLAYSIADITLVSAIDFASEMVDLKPHEDLKNLYRWHEEVSSRPSIQIKG